MKISFTSKNISNNSKQLLEVHRIFFSHAKKYLFVKRNAYIPIKQNPYAIHEL